MRQIWFVVLIGVWLASVGLARACAPAARGWVLFQLSPDFDAAFAEAARAHLAAELEPRGVAVCTELLSDTSRPPLARVFVQGAPDGVAVLRIEDDVTQTTVERRIDFSHVPSQGRALTFGLATDELLGVGWASVVAKRAPPAEVARPLATPLHQMTLGLDVSSFTNGPTLAGPAFVFSTTRGRWSPRLRLGARYGPSLGAVHGDVTFREWHAGLGLAWLITPDRGAWQIGPTIDAEMLRVTVQGQAQAGALAGRGDAWAALATAGLIAHWRVNRTVFVSSRVCGGYVLAPVRAADAGQRVGGMQSFVAQVLLGMGVAF